MSPSRKSARGRSFGLRFLIRLTGWSFSAAIALVVLSYVALPALLRYGLPHALARYGVVSSVEGARVSLTNERVTLVGFQLGQAGGPAIRWGEVTARVDLTELLRGNIRIIDFQVKDARVDLAQLRASKWKPPERAAAIPELRKLNIDIGNVVLRDLEFIGLSERIGRKVELRSLSVGSLSHLEAGARVAFKLEGYVGDGSLRLAGRARIVESLPVFEGRYEVGALDLKGFGQLLGLSTPGSVAGKVDGNGTFVLAYLQGDGEVHADLSGSARVNGFELDSRETSVTDTKAEWNGDAEVFWPVAGGPPRVVARGSVSSPALQAARRAAAGPYGIIGRGLQWSGEMRHAGEFKTDGVLSSDLLRIDASSEGTPRLGMEFSRVSADSRFRSGRGGYEFEAAKLITESATLTQGPDHGRQTLIAHRILLENVRLGSNGHLIGSLKAESAEATVVGASEMKPSPNARLISIGAKGIKIHAGLGASIDELDVEHAGLDFHQVSIDLSQAHARGVEMGANTPFEAEALSTSSLRQKTGVFETWGSNLQFSGTGISAIGEVFSDEAAAESLSQTMSGDPLWEASAVRAARLSIGSRKIEASRLSSSRFAYGKFGGTLIEIDRGDGVDFSIQYDSGINAGTVKLDSMRYRSGQFAIMEFAVAELRAPGITFEGELSAKSGDADSASYRDADSNAYLFETLKLGELSGSLSDELRIDVAHAGQFRHDRAAGADYVARGLELSRIAFSAAGKVSAIAGRLDSLEVALADGARLTLEDAVAARPARNSGGRFAADGGRVRLLSYNVPGERVLELLDIEVGAIVGDENEDHLISSVSAARAMASDPAVGGELETGGLQIATIRISADARVRADLASVNAVALSGYQGNPSPAFSSARINLKTLFLEPGERLRLGEVLLDDLLLTIGLDDRKEFLLPEPPFFSGDRQPFGSLTIERLEMRPRARVNFFDQSASPPFQAVISPLQARLADFHSNEPGRPAKFTLDGRINEFSNLTASGEFSIERDGLNLEVSGKVTAVELDRLNMYAAKHAQRAVRSGRGDATFDIAVRGRRLSGNIRFVFSKVEFERAEASATAEGEPQELSFENSIAMLKDNEGIVRLLVPLSGSLDDPRFHFSDVLVQALSQAVRSTVMLTFRPLGLLAGAAGSTGDSAALGFKPVAFEPGEHKLSGAGLAHLDALGRELKGHPAVELQVCGRAVSADRIRIEQRRSDSADGRPPLSDQGTFEAANVDLLLQNLARERASTVRRYLEENKGITQERLIECEAKVESVPGRLPRVDLPVRVETGPNATRSEEPSG